MKRIQGSKSVICTKKEAEIIHSLFWDYSCFYYELPLFELGVKPKFDVTEVNSDYVLVRTNGKKFTESFLNRINKTWNKMYEQ